MHFYFGGNNAKRVFLAAASMILKAIETKLRHCFWWYILRGKFLSSTNSMSVMDTKGSFEWFWSNECMGTPSYEL